MEKWEEIIAVVAMTSLLPLSCGVEFVGDGDEVKQSSRNYIYI